MRPLWLAALLFASSAPAVAAPARPNIVVFLADDHGYLDATPYGASDVRTPNMKRLAERGCTFTHLFVASPSCAPSRAALLTGLMPARNGAEANHSKPHDAVRKLPAYLKALGYETAAFGKVAHYRQVNLYGFDTADEKRHDARAIADFLARRDAKKPLCLFVGTHDPHVPWPEVSGYDPGRLKLPPTHIDTAPTRAFRARYYTAVTRADTWLGELLDLTGKKLDKNTLFLYTSDHGAQWPFGKWNLYDAGIRVPFLAAWPGVIKPGTRHDALLSWVDLLPTFIELAGGKPPRDLDGRSFAGILRGEKTAHRAEIFTTHSGDGRMNIYPIRSVRTQNHKYILNLHPEYQHTTHIDLAQAKDGGAYWKTWEAAAQVDARAAALVKRYHERPGEELYDLRIDPFEQKNLAADPAHATLRKSLRARLEQWMKEQKDTKKVFNIPRPLPGKR